jgi:hypothetical protein
VLTITSPEQYRALGHPLRQRLLFALGQRPATISQLAVALEAAQQHRASPEVAARGRAAGHGDPAVAAELSSITSGPPASVSRRAGAAHTGFLPAAGRRAGFGLREPLLVLRNIRLTRIRLASPRAR